MNASLVFFFPVKKMLNISVNKAKLKGTDLFCQSRDATQLIQLQSLLRNGIYLLSVYSLVQLFNRYFQLTVEQFEAPSELI